MPRLPRLHVPGGTYHVTLRGNHRQPIFFRPSDHRQLEELLAEALSRFGGRVHAYCWMTNHIHLAIQIADQPLGRLMQRVASLYARRVQRAIPTSGHLFERRYHPVLVDTSAYLARLIRYIHLNPVRAGLVTDPADYAWSSHRGYLGLHSVSWLTTELGLSIFANDVDPARRAYQQFIALGDSADDSEIFQRGAPEESRALGDDRFLENLRIPQLHRGERRSLEDLIEVTAREFGVTAAALASPSKDRQLARIRAVIAQRALDGRIASIAVVARHFNRAPSSLGQLLARHRTSQKRES